MQIEITVENHGPACSAPTEVRVEAAPFGAFVPWQPLVTLAVPPIEPGSHVTLRTVAQQPRPGAVGGFSGFLPGLLAPAAAGDRPRPILGGLGLPMLFPWLLGPQSGLPPDLLELLDGPRPHWAGNLNVWIGRRAVERHLAPRLRVYPGRCNLAVFFLGSGPDGYSFWREGPGSEEAGPEATAEDWRCALHECRTGRPIPWTEDPVREPRWHPTSFTAPLLFLLRPPEYATRGAARIHVTQRSSGKTALVEFDLDPTAQGPGCFQL